MKRDSEDEAALVRDLAVEHRLTSSPAVRAAIEMVCGGLAFCAPTMVPAPPQSPYVAKTIQCVTFKGLDRCILKPGHDGEHLFAMDPQQRVSS